MVRLSPERLAPGMVVGRSILDETGRVLLTAGQVLNERYIQKIQERGIATVYIQDQFGIEDSAPLVSPTTVTRATKTLKQSYRQCAQTGKANLKPIQPMIDGVIDDIIDDLVANRSTLVGMTELKTHDDYTYQHCVSVCVLALMLGISNGYSRSQLQALGTGAILHDIGKVTTPLEILNKPGALTEEEFSIVKRHPLESYNIIKESSRFGLLSAYIALEHHERLDGNGYPRGIGGDNIHEYGQIVAVADMFDALVSDRPYRRGFSNQEAMQIIMKDKGTHLAPRFVDLLARHVNIYPPGTVVILSTNEVAIVTQDNLRDRSAPQVKLLFNDRLEAYDVDLRLDLATEEKITINKALGTSDAEKVICLYLEAQKRGRIAQRV